MDERGTRIKGLSREKLATILEKTKRQSSDNKQSQTSIVRQERRSNVFPLSFAQQAIWFLEQLNPNTPSYNLSLAYTARGNLDVDVLQRCLDEIVRRHEALRTTFQTESSGPVQVVFPPTPFPLRVIDLRDLPYEAREAEASRLAQEDSQRPFDLERDILLRVSLIELDEERRILVIVMHHIVFDAWSIGILFHEVQTLYEAFSQGRSSPLAELPFQYADFAVWQRQKMQDALKGPLAYWKRKLTPPPATLLLPTDRPRPRRQTFHGGHLSIALSPETYAALKAVGEREGATISMTLLAAFKTLLYRYSGQESFCVGAPILGRNHSQLEKLIGHFVNTLVMMTDLSGDPSFRELLRRVRQTNLEAYSHQDLPFEKLVEVLQLPRNSSHTPLFQVLFNFLNASHVRNSNLSSLPGVVLDPFESLETGAAFDLSLIIFAKRENGAESANLVFEYNTHLFDAETINRMLRSLYTLITSAIEDPNQRLSELSLLSEQDRRQLLVEWNATSKNFLTDTCIHQLFEAQVERTPDADAVVFQNQRLSYRELNARANEVARQLINSGIEKGMFVPVLIDRSLEFVIAVVAIMKTGAAFVPLDIRWPASFLKQCLQSLSIPLVTTQQTAALVPEHPKLIVDAEDDWTDVANLNIRSDSEDDIYAIYTSGSSRAPRAAIVRHRSITNHFLWMSEFFGAERAVVLQTARPASASMVWQIFWPLINGGVTILPDPDRETEVDHVTSLMAGHGVTVADFVPSVFNAIAPGMISSAESLQSLRWLVLGGEEISTAMTQTFMNRFPNVRVINLYGPAEADLGCICYEAGGAEEGKIPAGRPIANTKIFILDQHGNPAPPLVTGEIYLSGPCLGRGYLNDPERTKRVFVENPFTEIEEQYLYRTGDLGRFRSDGTVELIRRNDAVRQREWLQGEVPERQLAYWRTQLAELPVVEVPSDYARPKEPTGSRARRDFTIDAELSAGLREVAQTEGVTLFMVLLAGFALLLRRYTGEYDVAVGTPVANRTRGEIEGFLVNTLVLRVQVEGDESFAELLGRVKEVCLGAYAHQEVPFERVVEELQPERELGRTPLFQVLFALQNADDAELATSSIEPGLISIRTEGGAVQAELSFVIAETPGSLSGTVDYASELFESSTIDRLVQRYLRLLESAIASPRRPVWQLPLLDEEERRQLIEFGGQASVETEASVPELWEICAAENQDVVAIVDGSVELSYADLDQRANRLSGYLRGCGVRRGAIVGVCLERSADQIVSILAVLKTGAAYLPLDPELPLQRLRRIVEEARPALVLTNSEISLSEHELGVRVVDLSQPLEMSEVGKSEQVFSDELAYVIYTSGSTGEPKGVAVTHRALATFVTTAQRTYEVGSGDRVLQFAPLSFDLAAEEIWVTLCSGATLYLRQDEMIASAAGFLRACRDQRLTVIDLPTAYWHELVGNTSSQDWAEAESLRLVIIGGEAASSDHLARWRQLTGERIRLLNTYGPTETTIVATWCDLTQRGAGPNARVSIGRPLPHVETYVLDEYLQLAPVGVPGELYIGGAAVARGYLARPELTAQAFLPNPMSSREGGRLYRTGDMVRYTTGGDLEFIGRRDWQLKIRGFRIELREIEIALQSYPGVQAAVVVPRPDSSGNEQLAAYVVAPENSVVTDELRGYLKERLPAYMIPATLTLLARLPLTPSGKLDRSALPEPDQLAGAQPVMPQTPIEELMVGVWARVLNVPQVSVLDNFFDLGGHSLLATLLISRVRETFQVEMGLQQLFESPTVREFSACVMEALRSEKGHAAPPIVPVPAARRGSLSYAQERLWFLEQLAPGSFAYNVPVAVRMRGTLDVRALEKTLSEIVRRHQVLRTSLIYDDKPIQVISPPKEVTLPLEDLSQLPADERERAARQLAVEEAQRPFDLQADSLLRCRLLRLAAEEHVALLTMHHIVSDDWSMGVLVREVSTLYDAYTRGAESPLAELPVQYADYAVWQREWLQGEVLERQLAYWRKQLAGINDGVALPADRSRPRVQRHKGAVRRFALDAELSEGLREVARTEGVTLFMVLLAGFALLLRRYTGEHDVAVGTPVANRTRGEIEGLIGFFVNTLVLRVQVEGEESFAELLRRVKEVCLGAYAHQEVPFERVVEELQPERELGRTPLFQVLFALQNAGEAAGAGRLKLSGLELKPMEVYNQTAKFELSVTLLEGPEGLTGAAEYSTEIFEEESIGQLLDHYIRLLGEAVAAPQQPVRSLPLLSAAEREQLLFGWNAEQVELGEARSLTEMFEAEAQRRPEAVALRAGADELSYGELNGRANQLGAHLRRLGVGPEKLVGVCVERSVGMVTAMLAVLKAGGAYVPLDPGYPEERLRYMAADAGVELVISDGAVSSEVWAGVKEIKLAECWEELAQYSTDDVASGVSRENLAYVIYTSGSTGRPKGVMITHRSAVALLAWVKNSFSAAEMKLVVASTSICFDLSVFEIFGPLSQGGAVQVVENALALLELDSEAPITLINTVPSVMAELLRSGYRIPASVVTVNLAGEALSTQLVKEVYEAGTVQAVNDLYGPTEDTTYTTWERRRSEAQPSIGRPIPNTQLYILDEWQQPVPVGVSGEIYVGGAGLARGYWERPDQTAERFVPDRLSGAAGARLYRTGDVGRYRRNGEIEYLGRKDHQVKLRGFRIELEEIAAVLKEHAGVADAVVLLQERGAGGEPELVGYYVARAAAGVSGAELRSYLRGRLPDHMVPAQLLELGQLPLTANGKLDRAALPKDIRPETVSALPETKTEQLILEIWKDVLNLNHAGVNDNFFDLGGHSLLLARVHRKLQETLNVELSMVQMFQYPTIRDLAEFLKQKAAGSMPQIGPQNGSQNIAATSGRDIAVIGMSLRFPGARTVDEFWQNLSEGVESVSFFSREEALADGAPLELIDDANYVRAAGVLDEIEMFDASFFGLNPREAEIMDPQQRLFLQCAFEALESAGYDGEENRSPIGVFSGVGLNTYQFNLFTRGELLKSVGGFRLMLANDKDYLTTRASYLLRLKGPSVAVQTSCSTSLVALHLACQSLLNGECSMALAGGVSIRARQKSGYYYQAEGINSPDGHCRAFDAEAQGIVGGNGVGIVVLKRLADALADGDLIHAVIKGTAINNDGGAKVGYTAPSVEGQVNVIRAAQRSAGVSAETISYVEAHGTGTQLGDPIEVEALSQAFGTGAGRKGFCALGSVKTNIGHLDTAAGVAGLIKTILALKHKQIPPSLHFNEPNPRINFADSPFYVNNVLRDWQVENNMPRRAGVSSFGIGGTNAHVIVEEAPQTTQSDPGREWQVLFLSARSEAALERATTNLAEHLKRHPELNLADVAYTLQVGRKRFKHRRTVICRETSEAVRVLTERDGLQTETLEDQPERNVVMMFPGQGTQYVRMAHDLYVSEPEFRTHVDRCLDLLESQLKAELRECLLVGAAPGEPAFEQAREQLQQTHLAQLALFVVEYALAQLWLSWGIQPTAMIGHSIGEYVAACLANVLSLEDALRLVRVRGALMQQLPPGGMLAVSLPEQEAQSYLQPALSVAAVNGPRQCVISGSLTDIEQLQQALEQKNIACQRLRTSHAFHSAAIDLIQEQFAAAVSRITLLPPQIPYVSNVTGDWIKPEESTSPDYWVRHMRQTVYFGPGLQTLLQRPDCFLLEVGPGQTLGALARAQSNGDNRTLVCASLRREHERQSDGALLARAVGQLLLAGFELNWKAFYQGQQRQRCLLPAYPFEKQHYWIDPGTTLPAPVVEPKRSLEQWFYLPSWKRSLPPAQLQPQASEPSGWLVLTGAWSRKIRLVEQLEASGHEVVRVEVGAAFRQDGPGQFTVRPDAPEDYRQLFTQLRAQGAMPRRVAHLWSMDVETESAAQDYGFYSLVALAQVLSEQQDAERAELIVVTTGAQRVSHEEHLRPENAMLLGPCKVIPQEYPHITCRVLDVLPALDQDQLTRQILGELTTKSPDSVVAYRGQDRWVQTYEEAPLPQSGAARPARLRERGVYLITGGLGRIGLCLASYLAQAVSAQLVLTSTTKLPAREDWERWIAAHNESDRISLRLKQLLELEKQGATVMVAQVDVSDETGMLALLGQIKERFGVLHGVIYAAGIADTSAFHELSETQRERSEKQFRAKAYGLYVLERILADTELDFCILCSSLSSVLGGLGHTTYSAANLFMDVFVQRHNLRQSKTPWMSVNWDAWNFNQKENGFAGAAIAPAEGIEIFKRLLSIGPIPQIVISTEDLHAKIKKWTNINLSVPEQPPAATALPLHRVVSRRGNYVTARNEIELSLVQLWQELLGVQEISVHDNFFDLGGHSLLATQLISRIRQQFQVNIELRSFFEAPTPAELAARVEVALRGELTKAPPLRPAVARGGIAPLSYAQQRLWFLERLEPGSTTFIVALGVKLTGKLHVEAFNGALSEVVRRHESLRTTFDEVDGKPVQVIHPESKFKVEFNDLTEMAAVERQSALEKLTREVMQVPFNLQVRPLLRCRLVRLAEEEHVALLTMHHIVSDGWSMRVLVSEVSTLYDAYVRGVESPLAELPVQYADYAVWQREWLQGEVLEQQLAYWREQLAELPVVEVPSDYPRPQEPTWSGAHHAFTIDAELSAGLRELARAEGVTLFMVLLAGFALLLRRYTGERDLPIGTPVANRTRGEIEGLIGFFVNTLVLRVEVEGAESFAELLGRVKEVCLGAYAHQEVPFERVVEELQPERESGRTPLFQVSFALQNTGDAELAHSSSALHLSPIEVAGGTVQYELSLVLAEAQGSLSGAVQYSTELFASSTIERLVEHYLRLLSEVVAAPQQPVRSLSLLSAAEREQLLFGWNAEQLELGEARSLTEMFEAQAQRRPEAVAVRAGAEELSYGELNGRANQLAQHLRRLGVGPEKLVGVCVERSANMVTALLAVLKAGGAYVPLDPGYPEERLRYMAADAAVELVLSDAAAVSSDVWAGVKEVKLAECWAELGQYSTADLAPAVSGANLAYVIYTSGSTGRPKGVMVTHGNVTRLLASVQPQFQFSERDVWTMFHSYAFDFSVWEIWGALLSGGKLVVVPYLVSRSPGEFWQLLEREKVTVLSQTPSAFKALMRVAAGSGGNEQLRVVVFGGEALEYASLREWVSERGVERPALVNMYGITETTVHVTYHRVSEPEVQEERASLIGKPLADWQCYILDEWQEPVPVGVSGEIYVGGAGLARGYRERPEQTAERFVPDGLSGRAGARLYRTGDLGRYRLNGEIEYLGRKDQQVKLRGFRIELGEIESVLASYSEVSEAVVILKTGPTGDGRLVGYLVAREHSASVDGLRDWVKSKLPDYMVPSAFVWLERLPLTASGKVDRRALAALDAPQTSAEGYVPPGTEIEKLIAGVWVELLGVESVGLYDNFFELGGHSLLATQVMSRLRAVLGVELPLRSLFDNPTVAGLAATAETELGAAPDAAITPAPERASLDEGLPLSFAQERLWFTYLLNPNDTAYNLASAFRLSGQLDLDALEKSLTEIARRHESLRTTFAQVDERSMQLIAAANPIKVAPLELSDLPQQQKEREVRRLSQEQARLPFDLSAGPLWRVKLIRLQSEEHVLLLTMHHIITDGWSLGIFARDLVALYRSFSQHEPASLPELSIQYADFAVWQRNWLRGEVLDQQLEYWRAQLSGAPPVLKLPLDQPRPAAPGSRGARVSFRLELETTRALEQLSRRAGVTLFMTLLAAFKMLLQRYTGQADIVIGTDIANRNRTEIEDLIGFFVNMLVLRTDLSGDPSFVELLARVREVALGAYAHQDLPFARLVDELQIPRHTSYNPLFQVVFVLQNTPAGEAIVPGLQIEPFPIETEAVPFDMVLSMEEGKEGLTGTLFYRTKLFERATIERMVKHLRHLLETVVQDPEQRLSEFSLLAQADVREFVPETIGGLNLSQKELENVILELQRGRAE